MLKQLITTKLYLKNYWSLNFFKILCLEFFPFFNMKMNIVKRMMGGIWLLTLNSYFANFEGSNAFIWLTDITIKGSQWECIWFLWKDISSNHNLRWIPRIHLVLHPFIEASAKSENQKKKMLCWCVLVCYAQWAECLLLHEWYQDNRQRWMGKYTFRILKIQFAETVKYMLHCSSMGEMPHFARLIPG